MKCNPLRWLWGLVALLPLAILAIMSSRSAIEADLKARVQDSLKRANFGWAEVVMDGRDAQVQGKAIEEGDPDKALKIAYDTWGVRDTTNSATLIEKVDKYEWTALRRDNKIRLNGFVPSEKTRLDVLGMVKGTFPGLQVEDNTKLARGAPPLDIWLGGVGFGLKQLAQLKSGQVDLAQTNLTVTGEANDLAAYRGVRTALASNLPKGLKLSKEAVRPPLVKPYTWAAKTAGDRLLLSGYVPNDQTREQIVAAAKRALPKAQVVDEMQPAEGAPEGFGQAVTALLAELMDMEEARADLRDGSATIAGTTESAARSDGIRGALKKAIPASFKVTDQIRHREPRIKTMSPYQTTAQIDGSTVVLTGFVPSEEARQSLLGQARQHFKSRSVQDRMEIAAGQTGSPGTGGWQRCVDTGMAALERLGNGRAVLIDRRLDVTGATDNDALARALPADVRTAAGRDCDADVHLTLNPRPDAGRAEAEAARLKLEAEARARTEADMRAKADAEARAKAAAGTRQQQAASCQDTLRSVMREGVINFKRASAEIEPTSFATLNKLAEVAGKCPDVAIDVEGHTDAEGTQERNQALSDRRARSVSDYLIRAGVVSTRLNPIGYGQTRNIAPNDTPENRAKNRRIEFSTK